MATGCRRARAALYLRPFMFASEAFLGVRPADRIHVLRHRLARSAPISRAATRRSPSGCRDDYTRAAPGGTGAAKCGGNYAASLVAQAEAIAQRLRPGRLPRRRRTQRWVEELGGMNIFFIFDDGTIVTPPLGTILPGITRDSRDHAGARRGLHGVRGAAIRSTQWQDDAQSGTTARSLRLRHRGGDRRRSAL